MCKPVTQNYSLHIKHSCKTSSVHTCTNNTLKPLIEMGGNTEAREINRSDSSFAFDWLTAVPSFWRCSHKVCVINLFEDSPCQRILKGIHNSVTSQLHTGYLNMKQQMYCLLKVSTLRSVKNWSVSTIHCLAFSDPQQIKDGQQSHSQAHCKKEHCVSL